MHKISNKNCSFDTHLTPKILRNGCNFAKFVLDKAKNIAKNRQEKSLETVDIQRFQGFLSLAGAEGLEPSARGFGDRCSTN